MPNQPPNEPEIPPKINPHQIDIWLAEYQACHQTRNHYDAVRWTIGSIFFGTSLALFGLSLDKPLVAVLLSFLFSISLTFVWYLYAHHVNPYIMESIFRCHAIEKEIRNKKFNIELHKLIRKTDDDKEVFNSKGTRITYGLFSLIMGMWILRISWSIYELFNGITCDFVFWIFILALFFIFFQCLFSLVHKKFNQKDWGKEIKKILNDCKKSNKKN